MPGTDASTIPMRDGIPLKRRVLAATSWSLVGHAVSQAIRFGSNLIMTRLLVPEMFGVMAIATIVMIGLSMFSDLGFRQSIVQSHRGDDPVFLNTAWSLQILRGFILWIIALAISIIILLVDRAGMAPGENVYADPNLPLVIAAVSFGLVIGAFESTKLSEGSRNLALGRITQIEITTQIVGVLCMLAWASVDLSIWALVIGGIVAGILRTVLSHAWLPGTANRWHWDKSALLELVHFGKWIFASSILGFLVANGDRLLLGWMVDSSLLGIYMIAFSIYSALEQVTSRIIGSVGFPALSEVARNQRDLKAAYYRFHAVVAAITYFCAGALIISSETLIHALYDHRYTQAGWMLQILAVALLSVPFQIALQCYLAVGMPQLHSRILVVRLIALLTGIPVGFHFFGLAGALWALVMSQFSILPMLIYYNIALNIFDGRREVLFLPTVLVGMGIGSLVVLAFP